MQRRCRDHPKMRLVFIADGANWIWDRVGDLANDHSWCILDFYHASEHLSDLCKALFGEGTDAYWQRYHQWRDMLWDGHVGKLLSEVKQRRDDGCHQVHRDLIQAQINYFSTTRSGWIISSIDRCASQSAVAPSRAAARTPSAPGSNKLV